MGMCSRRLNKGVSFDMLVAACDRFLAERLDEKSENTNGVREPLPLTPFVLLLFIIAITLCLALRRGHFFLYWLVRPVDMHRCPFIHSCTFDRDPTMVEINDGFDDGQS